MKRSEFVPGVLFHMPGINRHQVFRLHSYDNGLHIIERAGHFFKSGEFFPAVDRDREVWHFKVTARGIQLWTVADTVYLYSKTVPFEHLTKVEIPSPATNPVTI